MTDDYSQGLRLTRRMHITDPAEALEAALKENDVLAAAIADLQANALTAEERAYIINRKDADERAAWAWKILRTYAPWVTSVCTAVGMGAYWLVTNFQIRHHP